MAGYLIARVEITDPEKYKDYMAVTPGLIAKHGRRLRTLSTSPSSFSSANSTQPARRAWATGMSRPGSWRPISVASATTSKCAS